MKKGFTLIEVTVVILLLGVLSIFIIPKVTTTIGNNKAKACASIVTSAEEAAKACTYMHIETIEEDIVSNGYFDITIGELQDEGLLKMNIENPYEEGYISTSNNVRVTKNGNKYIYTYMGGEC